MLAKAKNPCISVGTEIIAPVTGKSAEPVHYKLCGVLYHHGESAASGHYTVDVLHPNRDCSGEGWLHIDDEAVNAVQHEDVFGSDNNERRNNQCAYLLFYCRTAPART
jgi:ubiquitin carboxyl-terminal hydrolase 10